MYPDVLRLDDIAYVTPKMHAEMKRTHVRSGDVLLNMTGASIGTCTSVPDGFGEAKVATWHVGDAALIAPVCEIDLCKPFDEFAPVIVWTAVNGSGSLRVSGPISGKVEWTVDAPRSVFQNSVMIVAIIVALLVDKAKERVWERLNRRLHVPLRLVRILLDLIVVLFVILVCWFVAWSFG